MIAGVVIGARGALGCVAARFNEPAKRLRATTAICWKRGRAAPVFCALWGVVLGSGFALATLVTGVAFVFLPRCAG